MDSVVAFLVLSHHKPRLVERLAGRLSDTRAAVTVVHHDAKSVDRPRLPPNGRAMFMPEPVRSGGAISVR